MANVTKTVKSSGGDYTSLNAALAGMSGDLTTNCGGTGSAGILTIECYAFEDTTAASTGTGYTTSSSYYINITVPTAERHDGKWNTAKYRLTTAGYGLLFNCDESYVRFTGLQFYCSNTTDTGDPITLLDLQGIGATSAIYVENCIFKGAGATNWGNGSYGIMVTTGTTYIWNNIFENINKGDSGYEGWCICYWGGTSYVYNNTMVNTRGGVILAEPTTIYFKNNIINGCDIATSSLTGGTNVDYNATDLGSLGYTDSGGHSHVSHTFSFTDADNDNFHLAATDEGALDHGVDLSAIFTTDIDGQTRSGTWDIGADEYVAAAALPKFMYHYMHH